MRVLWFTNSSSCYTSKKKNGHNGGGWISSLQKEIENISTIELGVAFHLDNEPHKIKDKNVTYFPIPNPTLKKYQKQLIWLFKGEEELTKILEEYYLNSYINVINEFKPDIIHIFGSERYFSIIANHINIPIILHIQGFINPIKNAYYPNGISERDYLWLDYNPFKILKRKRLLLNLNNSARREIKYLSKIKYFMGRTEWDYRLSKIYNPNSVYYHCDEILRSDFYLSNNTIINNNKIVSTISSPLYKGEDLILKTAKILHDNIKIPFEWHIFGINKHSPNYKLTNIESKDINIIYRGVVDSTTLKDELENCSIYVHPSYIDNSPNSLCEAQIMGIPSIATYVGGISSLIEDGNTGYLVPANDPYQTAYIIAQLLSNAELRHKIGEQAKTAASIRHNKDIITNNLIKIYIELKK